MDSLSINRATCKKCHLCVEVCPNQIYTTAPTGEVLIRPDRIGLCFKCGQCMAICSSQSVIVEGLSYDADFFELPDYTPDQDSFFNLISTRRAIRNFKEIPVPSELLQKVVDAITFAPPGFPPLKTELIVVPNREMIKSALPAMIQLYEKIVAMMGKPFSRHFIRKEIGDQKFRTMETHLVPMLKSRLPGLKAGTEDTLTRNAPAMILFLAAKNGEDIRQDISIAATYGMLAAHSLGLGGSIMDIISPAIDKEPELRKKFCIPDNHEVVTSLIIGYPKYKYKRGIKRNLKSVKWLS